MILNLLNLHNFISLMNKSERNNRLIYINNFLFETLNDMKK